MGNSYGSSSDSGPPSGVMNGQINGMPARPDDEITLQELVGMLWGGKWVILGTFVLVVALGAAYTFSQTPIYETSSLVLVEGQESQMSSILGERGSFSPFGSQRNLANEVLVANQSEAITRNVATHLDSMETNPRTGDRLAVLTGPEGERRTVAEIEGDLVSEGGKVTMSASAAGGNLAGQYESADAINMTVRGVSASEAALISNLFAQAYIDYNERKSKESARSTRRFLENQADKFKTQVDQAEQKLETFMQEEKAVALDQETRRVVDQIANLEARRDELQIELDMKSAALNKKREELANIRPNLAERISSGLEEELSQMQKEKAEVAAEINAVQRRHPDLNPGDGTPKARELARLLDKKETLEQSADSLARRYVDETIAAGGVGSIPAKDERAGQQQGRGLSYVVGLQREVAEKRIEVSGLEAQLATVMERLEEYRQTMNELPAQSLELAQLQRERRSAEEIYKFVQEQLQETRMAEESEVGYAEIVRSAWVPTGPVSPNTKLNLVLAAFLGLLGGMGLVFLREALDTKLRSPEDLDDLGVRVLGTIPSMERLLGSELEGDELVELDDRTVPAQLVMLTAPMSAAAESYRRLRANLQFARPDERLQTVMITSANKGDGKTTTASNLALSMASAGQRTLLVDADLRQPQLHKYIDREQTPGLTEALYDESIISGGDGMSTGIDDLSVLTAGGEVPNPSELLGSKRMRQLIERMETAFDLVVIDTPPLLLFSDPVSVVSHTDGALLVAEANRTDAPALEQALSLLEDVDSVPVGAVLNRFDPERASSYGYGYGYGYDYGYGSYEYGSVQEYYEEDEEESSGMLSFLRSG